MSVPGDANALISAKLEIKIQSCQLSFSGHHLEFAVISLVGTLTEKNFIVAQWDSSPTRQFTDTIIEDSSPIAPKLLKTVHRHIYIMLSGLWLKYN